jgi:toxin HigB-1
MIAAMIRTFKDKEAEKVFSIRINNQWRICFEWRDDGVYDVEIVDYH